MKDGDTPRQAEPENLSARTASARPRPDLSIVREDIKALKAYPVAKAEGLIKLDAMENPYRLPTELAALLGERLAQIEINRYPPSDPTALKTKLARYAGLPAGDGFSLMLGNGSDELIHLIIQACATSECTVLSPWPSFVMYELFAKFNRCRFVGVDLNARFELDKDEVLASIAAHRPAITFIAYPNNPTGGLFEPAAMEEIIAAAAPGVVIIDEAYFPFAQASWISQLPRWSNLMVLRTFSKLGLAGIRLGYLCADKAWINEFEKLRPPYNVNAFTLAAADLVLDRIATLDEQAAQLRVQRAQLFAELSAIAAIHAFPSAANFILFRVRAPDEVFDKLKERGILVKNVSRAHPLLKGCLRTTIGTPSENAAFLTALKDSV